MPTGIIGKSGGRTPQKGAAAQVTTSRLQGVVVCVGELWLWGSFRSSRAFAQAADGTDFLCSDKGVQNHAGETVRTGKISSAGLSKARCCCDYMSLSSSS